MIDTILFGGAAVVFTGLAYVATAQGAASYTITGSSGKMGWIAILLHVAALGSALASGMSLCH